jgi:hypothetical protein
MPEVQASQWSSLPASDGVHTVPAMKRSYFCHFTQTIQARSLAYTENSLKSIYSSESEASSSSIDVLKHREL